jgi:hypothetical protein
MKYLFIPLIAAVSLFPFGAHSTVYTINPVQRGWYNNSGTSVIGGLNYITGYTGSARYRDWFVYDLSGLPSGIIISATFSAYNPTGGDIYGNLDSGFFSLNPSETFQVGSVSTPITTLRAGTGGVAVYNDLAAGTVWGAQSVSAADNGQTVVVNLNSAFASAAQTYLGNGSIALGGWLAGDAGFIFNAYLFGWSNNGSEPTRLTLDIVPVPEPSSLTLVALTMLSCLLFKRLRPAA